ncbi:unnamed protein product [Meloidogyne enterolobii]|uniref:Uncharacterized protein n=1 Tax=Meloidogyne enterolobii TaxID=390850 RepID=A0ACB1A8T0_MELEN
MRLQDVVKFISTQTKRGYQKKNKNELDYLKKKAEGTEFVKIYKHFIVFSCITEDEAGQVNSCGFLENLDKINEQIEKIEQIEIFHIGLKTEDCPTEIKKIKNEDEKFDEEENVQAGKLLNLNFCTSWLVGIKIKDKVLNKEMLKFEIEKSVGATGVTEDLKIFVILNSEIENWFV